MNVIVVDDEPLALRGIGRLVREAAAADDKDAGGDAACADAPATVGGGVATSAAGDVVSDAEAAVDVQLFSLSREALA